MSPVHFPQANTTFGPPGDMDESQVKTIHAFVGSVAGGNMDGSDVVIVAWQPDEADLARLNEGGQIFLQVLGGLAPHALMTEFPAFSGNG